ncbi:hypothetical protein QEJ31_08355 [Pigmentibacter sp. JX0631]|uniref:hypothetical protein n=1 Tax=Pigmentibacter sp. JX0631 TaxID=2976982 RepID=UPI00246857C6|nr:hypothetical protein [Pigmentibacter sp. JX0631]WGL58549.1 hypothetical protein QEJ31_08355 [Pigmentibacter sp. JX0631]
MLTKIILLYSFSQAGDTAHIKSLEKVLSGQFENKEIYSINANEDKSNILKEFKEIKDKKNNSLQVQNETKHLVLTVGEKGGEALEAITDGKLVDNNYYIYWGMHQYSAKIKDYKKLKLDHLQIPETSLNSIEKIESVKDIPNVSKTLTVPNINPTIEELKNTFAKWEINKQFDLEKNYITVLLPGDAPDSKNKIYYFSKDSAYSLFKNVQNIWLKSNSKKTVIVQNGPRTGKYDPKTGDVICSHEYKTGESNATAVDNISEYFINLLQENKIPFVFSNFSFEIKDKHRIKHSSFDPILFLAYKTKSIFIFPGESVSLIGQLPFYLDPENVIAFYSSSMNEEHKTTLEAAFKNGYLSKFNAKGEIEYPEKPTKLLMDDNTKVANDILKGYNRKFKN